FSAVAGGTPPLNYQWAFNGTNLTGATNTSLYLTGIQTFQAGNYSVQVTNSFGLTNSAAALLTVLVPSNCAVAPTGMVSWWRGEGNAVDEIGGNHGTLVGNMSFGPAAVGQG